MRIAVISLTRDRLDYTKHCFATLQQNAGVAYDHYVLDNGSRDGTVEWLHQGNYHVTVASQNLGITPALNILLNKILPESYDVIVRVDNDTEFTIPDTLRITCETALKYDAICGPFVEGLNHPPQLSGVSTDDIADVNGLMGGMCLAIPAHIFDDYRYDETHPPWTGDEWIAPYWVSKGGRAGYIHDLTVNHFKTTQGQVADIPDYFLRRALEGGPPS